MRACDWFKQVFMKEQELDLGGTINHSENPTNNPGTESQPENMSCLFITF
jgi:hypothetical protein